MPGPLPSEPDEPSAIAPPLLIEPDCLACGAPLQPVTLRSESAVLRCPACGLVEI
ncbi:hypothetical protein [uncultured Amnibacterium sp.]|uniref:hypothetical protein n=1 Tax=uncultured Amnibacterium sp. TaxID=1631851 RepID=UPI0035CA360A